MFTISINNNRRSKHGITMVYLVIIILCIKEVKFTWNKVSNNITSNRACFNSFSELRGTEVRGTTNNERQHQIPLRRTLINTRKCDLPEKEQN